MHEGHLRGSAAYRRIMAAMVCAGMVTFVLLYDTQALLPAFHDDFGVTPAQATLSMSVTTAGLALGLLVAGPASEVLGRTRLIVGAVWLSTLVALVCPFAWSWHALLVLRFVQGVVLAGLPAVATAYLREELHASAQARAAGVYIGGTALGGMTGRLLTAPVTEALDWRWGLGAAAVLSLGCAVAVTVALPPSRNFQARARQHLALGAMSRAALADPALRRLYVIGACSVGALVVVFNALGFRLVAAPHHLGLGAISLLYLVYPLGTVSATVSGAWADRVGRRAVLPVGCAVAIAGVALTVPHGLVAIVAGLACLTTGFFVVHGIASGWVAARAHAAGASASQAAAFYLCAYYVGSSVFGSLGSSAWTAYGWAGPAALALGLLVVVGAAGLSLRHVPILRPVVAAAR
ncbi:MFS transporter [Pimelobacter simplex]|uniref:MFS transporter n=1 Tax=Nocardioides simplex TaxID=2045 RepID=UPI003AAF7B4F